MDIKSIPAAQGTAAVEKAGDEQRRRDLPERSKKGTPKKAESPPISEPPAAEQSAKAADAALLAEQPIDSQTVVDLLNHRPQASAGAKFPTPKAKPAEPQNAKKLNRSA